MADNSEKTKYVDYEGLKHFKERLNETIDDSIQEKVNKLLEMPFDGVITEDYIITALNTAR